MNDSNLIREKTAERVIEAIEKENLMNKTVAENFGCSPAYFSWLKHTKDHSKIPGHVWDMLNTWRHSGLPLRGYIPPELRNNEPIAVPGPMPTEEPQKDIFSDLSKAKYGTGAETRNGATKRRKKNIKTVTREEPPAPVVKKRGPKKGYRRPKNESALRSGPKPGSPERGPLKPYSDYTIGDIKEILENNPSLRGLIMEHILSPLPPQKVKLELEIEVSLKN